MLQANVLVFYANMHWSPSLLGQSSCLICLTNETEYASHVRKLFRRKPPSYPGENNQPVQLRDQISSILLHTYPTVGESEGIHILLIALNNVEMR
jgi:hypothetical protein